VTAGVFTKRKGSYIVSYEESELTGMKGTKTTLLVEPMRITLTRTGPINSEMVFEMGQKHLSYYDTANGSLMVGVNAEEVSSDINDAGGNISVGYTLELDHAVAGYNYFSMNVRESGKPGQVIKS
jgi:uncharacterized beta-barrel protein YwiB (DUF1934 family)